MPWSAPTRCAEPGCTEPVRSGRCAEHQRTPWADRPSSQERYGLSGSAQQKLHHRILERDRYVCYWCGQGEPRADEVDHVIEVEDGGARTDPANLAAIHGSPCHEQKSRLAKRRRAAARRAARAGGPS